MVKLKRYRTIRTNLRMMSKETQNVFGAFQVGKARITNWVAITKTSSMFICCCCKIRRSTPLPLEFVATWKVNWISQSFSTFIDKFRPKFWIGLFSHLFSHPVLTFQALTKLPLINQLPLQPPLLNADVIYERFSSSNCKNQELRKWKVVPLRAIFLLWSRLWPPSRAAWR